MQLHYNYGESKTYRGNIKPEDFKQNNDKIIALREENIYRYIFRKICMFPLGAGTLY